MSITQRPIYLFLGCPGAHELPINVLLNQLKMVCGTSADEIAAFQEGVLETLAQRSIYVGDVISLLRRVGNYVRIPPEALSIAIRNLLQVLVCDWDYDDARAALEYWRNELGELGGTK